MNEKYNINCKLELKGHNQMGVYMKLFRNKYSWKKLKIKNKNVILVHIPPQTFYILKIEYDDDEDSFIISLDKTSESYDGTYVLNAYHNIKAHMFLLKMMYTNDFNDYYIFKNYLKEHIDSINLRLLYDSILSVFREIKNEELKVELDKLIDYINKKN